MRPCPYFDGVVFDYYLGYDLDSYGKIALKNGLYMEFRV